MTRFDRLKTGERFVGITPDKSMNRGVRTELTFLGIARERNSVYYVAETKDGRLVAHYGGQWLEVDLPRETIAAVGKQTTKERRTHAAPRRTRKRR